MLIFLAIVGGNVVVVGVIEWSVWENVGCFKFKVVDSNIKLVSFGCVLIVFYCFKFVVRF